MLSYIGENSMYRIVGQSLNANLLLAWDYSRSNNLRFVQNAMARRY